MADQWMTLEVEDGVAVLTNNRPEKHNAANDEMDRQLFEALEEIHGRTDLCVVLWRGEGKSFSSGRDTSEIGVRREDITNFEFSERGHKRTQMFFTLPVPMVVAMKGWAIGGSFERTLRADMRIANPLPQKTVQEGSMGMTAIYEAADYAEMKAARAEGREPSYRGR